ncbi:MAG: flavin reductase family protein [Porticoccaceae bacterium]|jgi:flavin reductase (DIM6/NTAB) family NADH-FMN oxidoreductase RutF|nr:flavin reductase family protein [Porticoccaceae bacterium]|tara:strand:+ start:379 stop:891 length:513 start_codon:yes stop_codon:yes gene_type:complete
MPTENLQKNTVISIDTPSLRNALGSFATGVTVITALGIKGQKVGMTANSFSSVSLDPALVLWSIGRDSNCFDDFIAAKAFAIHMLTSDQQELSNRFARTGSDRFAGLDCPEGVMGIPLLPHSSACFQCTIEHQYDGGDHVILVGKVVEFTDNGHNPLIFHRGNYASLQGA